jgi:hypothetical protein
MTDGELNRLEQEVEQARTRLTVDLERLRAPETFASFKQAVVHEVSASKDEWIEEGKAIATDRMRQIVDDLKNRAAANPLAAAAIGAGLLWHLSRRPPITSLLIGAGVFGLLRTDPGQPSAIEPWVSRARDAGEVASEKVSQWRSAARDAATQAAAAGGVAKESAQSWAAQSTDMAQERLTDLADRTSALADRTRRDARRWTEDAERRDAVLFGAAAAALAAALGIAYQRRAAG